MKILAALLSGSLFGLGLAVAGMTSPAKVIHFLDITGQWDPSLAFVMGSALLITTPAYWLARRKHARPLIETRFFVPAPADIDRRLLTGAALFGIGWGIAGLCPGPALADLSTGKRIVLLFVVMMAAGMGLHDMISRRQARRALHASVTLPQS